MSTAEKRRSFFEFPAEVDAFNKAFTLALAKYQTRFMAQYVNPKNTQRFHHGNSWRNPANTETRSGKTEILSTELLTRLDDIVANDLRLLERSFSEIGDSMQRQFAQMMYSTVSEACDATGNVINAEAEGSLPKSFFAMMEKIEFVADKHGNVSLPEVHAAPGVAERMISALEAEPPEFVERFEQLKQEKILKAKEREVARKAKFIRYGE